MGSKILLCNIEGLIEGEISYKVQTQKFLSVSTKYLESTVNLEDLEPSIGYFLIIKLINLFLRFAVVDSFTISKIPMGSTTNGVLCILVLQNDRFNLSIATY